MKCCMPKLFLLIVVLTGVTFSFAQRIKVTEPELLKLQASGKIKVYNRTVSIGNDATYKNSLHLDEKPGSGVAWLSKTKFSNGTIEFDVKGKDLMQQSFVGIAFHGINDTAYDAIYFRPFNFLSADMARRNHSVQYISLPDFDWQKLREEFPGKYEDSVHAAPNPNEWFHVSIVVQSPTVSVYVNRNVKASLVVEKISKNKNGSIGFWVGNGSAGDFANMKLTEMIE